jgi:hypothetical protein
MDPSAIDTAPHEAVAGIAQRFQGGSRAQPEAAFQASYAAAAADRATRASEAAASRHAYRAKVSARGPGPARRVDWQPPWTSGAISERAVPFHELSSAACRMRTRVRCLASVLARYAIYNRVYVRTHEL